MFLRTENQTAQARLESISNEIRRPQLISSNHIPLPLKSAPPRRRAVCCGDGDNYRNAAVCMKERLTPSGETNRFAYDALGRLQTLTGVGND